MMTEDIRIAAVAEKHGASPEGVDAAAHELARHFGISLGEALDVMEQMCTQPAWPAWEERA